MVNDEKQQISLAIIGHVDHGKSTLVGRLLMELGVVSRETIDKYRREAPPDKEGKGFEYAHVTDDLPDERKRGVTIRPQIQQFETKNLYFTLKDLPGHDKYINNAIRNLTQADAAILLIDVTKGIQHETREHALLAKAFGITQVVVAANKMDATFPQYNEQQFNATAADIRKMLGKIGYADNKYQIIPISAYEGDNLVSQSTSMKWHAGPTLVDALNTFTPQKNYNNYPFRCSLGDVMCVPGQGYILIGDVYSGTVSRGDEIVITPGNYRAKIRTIEKQRSAITNAKTGDPIGLGLTVIGRWEKTRRTLKPGYVVSHPGDVPTIAKEFSARIAVLHHPAEITQGYAPTAYMHKAISQCALKSIDAILDPTTLKPMENLGYLKTGDVAQVTFKPLEPLVMDTYDKIPSMGRFVIRDLKETVAAGIVTNIIPKED